MIFDRGKDVQERRKDLRAIQQLGTVNPDSNYCFGEGGAGTYSDGKLYTAAKKRGSIRKVLELLVEHGAHPDILVDAHPHIGSNKLPQIVQAIRHTIEGHGGEVHFASRVTDLVIRDKTIYGVIVNGRQEHLAANVILATGHSARDIYELLHQKNLHIEPKPFAMGIRIEHAQGVIDQMQYHLHPRGRHLPAASYKMVAQIESRGVFSFCMSRLQQRLVRSSSTECPYPDGIPPLPIQALLSVLNLMMCGGNMALTAWPGCGISGKQRNASLPRATGPSKPPRSA